MTDQTIPLPEPAYLYEPGALSAWRKDRVDGWHTENKARMTGLLFTADQMQAYAAARTADGAGQMTKEPGMTDERIKEREAFEAWFADWHDPNMASIDEAAAWAAWQAATERARRVVPPSEPPDVVAVAVALEQQRALKIVEAVDKMADENDMDRMSTYWCAWSSACEEVTHRLRTEQWSLCGVDSPPPLENDAHPPSVPAAGWQMVPAPEKGDDDADRHA